MTLFDLPHNPRKMPCSYPGCERDGLLNHEMCDLHRDNHRARNRKWKRWATLRQVIQLRLL